MEENAGYLTLLSPIDADVQRARKFDIQHLSGSEGLCRDFHYVLSVSSKERLTIEEIDTLVGGTITVRIGMGDVSGKRKYRYINGMVYSIREVGLSRAPLFPEIWRYRLEISSWMKQLQYVKECRIFQKDNNTNISIVRDVLNELGMTDFRDETRRGFPKNNYSTIYQESYFHYIIRLLQEEQILWYFEHNETRHTLVLVDDALYLPEIPTDSWLGIDRFNSFCRCNSYIPIDGCQTATFDHEGQIVKKAGASGVSSAESLKRFKYPGKFSTMEEGHNKMSREKIIIKSDELLYQGTSTIRLLQAGNRFSLIAPMLKESHQQKFLLKTLQIEASETHYSNSFSAFPAKTPYFFSESDRIEKPRIIGNQTAVVVGTKNDARIHTDRLGNIMVRFHWDHHSTSDCLSAFVRNALPAAGPRRGFVFSPNIGDEVVVEFEDGDPDKPIIVGRVFSALQRAPIRVNSHPRQSVIQAKDGKNANRILFEDKKGAEILEFRAKKDMNIKVGGSLNIKVDNDLSMTGHNETVTVGSNSLTGDIIRLSLKGNDTRAGNKITNSTGLAIADISGCIENNKAGNNTVNMAFGMVNTSAVGATVSKSPIILNATAKNIDFKGEQSVTHKGMLVTNTGNEAIENNAGQSLKQDAGLAILNKTKNEKNDLSSESATKSMLIKDKGDTIFNKD